MEGFEWKLCRYYSPIHWPSHIYYPDQNFISVIHASRHKHAGNVMFDCHLLLWICQCVRMSVCQGSLCLRVSVSLCSLRRALCSSWLSSCLCVSVPLSVCSSFLTLQHSRSRESKENKTKISFFHISEFFSFFFLPLTWLHSSGKVVVCCAVFCCVARCFAVLLTFNHAADCVLHPATRE